MRWWKLSVQSAHCPEERLNGSSWVDMMDHLNRLVSDAGGRGLCGDWLPSSCQHGDWVMKYGPTFVRSWVYSVISWFGGVWAEGGNTYKAVAVLKSLISIQLLRGKVVDHSSSYQYKSFRKGTSLRWVNRLQPGLDLSVLLDNVQYPHNIQKLGIFIRL